MSLPKEEILLFSCENCGNKIGLRLSWVRRLKEYNCHCGSPLDFGKNPMIQEILEAEQSIQELRETLDKLSEVNMRV